MRETRQLYRWLNIVQGVLYPPRCLLCGAPGSDGRDLCAKCLAELPHNPRACRLCALPLTGQGGAICGSCLRQPPPLDGSLIPFRYAPPLDHLLLGLKFNRQLPNARLLGGLMAEFIAASGDPLPDCIVPVPLHNVRLRERGYNQALELARPVAKGLGVPLAVTLASRTVATDAQSRQNREERKRNIRGAFAVQGEAPAHIAILDDVVTTGSTVNELAKALRKAGAERVVVWACARVR